MRAIASFPDEGIAVEVRLSDGELLSIIRSLHDISTLDHFPAARLDQASIHRLQNAGYLREGLADP